MTRESISFEHQRLLDREPFVSPSEVIESNEVTHERKSMAELQLEYPDIAPILRLRLQQSEQPQPEEVLSESEAAKSCGANGIT